MICSKLLRKDKLGDRGIKKLLNLVIANVAIGVCLAINFVILRFGEIFVCLHILLLNVIEEFFIVWASIQNLNLLLGT